MLPTHANTYCKKSAIQCQEARGRLRFLLSESDFSAGSDIPASSGASLKHVNVYPGSACALPHYDSTSNTTRKAPMAYPTVISLIFSNPETIFYNPNHGRSPMARSQLRMNTRGEWHNAHNLWTQRALGRSSSGGGSISSLSVEPSKADADDILREVAAHDMELLRVVVPADEGSRHRQRVMCQI